MNPAEPRNKRNALAADRRRLFTPDHRLMYLPTPADH
jgi:hypothetical protein